MKGKSEKKPKGKIVAHVSEKKIERVRSMSELMKKKTVMIISVKGLPSAQFQEIKKEMRANAKIKMARKVFNLYAVRFNTFVACFSILFYSIAGFLRTLRFPYLEILLKA